MMLKRCIFIHILCRIVPSCKISYFCLFRILLLCVDFTILNTQPWVITLEMGYYFITELFILLQLYHFLVMEVHVDGVLGTQAFFVVGDHDFYQHFLLLLVVFLFYCHDFMLYRIVVFHPSLQMLTINILFWILLAEDHFIFILRAISSLWRLYNLNS